MIPSRAFYEYSNQRPQWKKLLESKYTPRMLHSCDKDHPFCTEFIEGELLSDHFRRNSASMSVDIFRQVADYLTFFDCKEVQKNKTINSQNIEIRYLICFTAFSQLQQVSKVSEEKTLCLALEAERSRRR
jgi:hypothetical protein